jgi:fructosamine-3-kinase
VADRLGQLTGLAVREARVVGSQHGYQHLMVTLSSGQRAFAKAVREAITEPVTESAAPGAEASPQTAAAFAAEANGLRWLAEAAAVPVPAVLAVGPSALVISMITPQRATPEAAFGFGTDLARLHAAGADAFGAPWPGFIASLPLDNTALARGDNPPGPPAGLAREDDLPGPAAGTPGQDWPEWYADRRLLPYLRRAVDAGALRAEDGRLVEAVIDRIGSLAGPAEPPSRIHGDCWAGNVLWSGGRGWLIDPAAHGGHRETDLAMLALFGAPSLDRILAGYNDTVPLAPGWRSRVPLHQLHPLLVHACLFGASYREEVRSAARAALAI